MFVDAPRTSNNGTLSTNIGLNFNVAPTDSSATTGFASITEAIAKAQVINTNIPNIMVAQATRANMQSGIVSYKRYRNTSYRASYMRRRILARDVTLYKSSTRPRFRCESLPIGLGYAGGFTTGWLEQMTGEHSPWGSINTAVGVYNRLVITNLRNRGVVECKQKMLESKMDLAESLVDLNKTVMLVVERAYQVLLAWTYVRKKQYDKALKVLGLTKRNLNFDNAASAWLELQYGWLPLLSDIFSATEATKDLFNDPLAHHTYAKRRVKEPLWVSKLSGDSTYWGNQTQTDVSLCEVETKFRFRVDNALLAYITGFQLSNPLYVFWVSMPFTFVVDWLLPIGDWLSSLTATHGLTFVDGYQTTKTFASATVTATRKRAVNSAYWDYHGPVQTGKSQVEVAYIERTAYSGWPMSYTYFTFPFTSPQRIASAISLTKKTAKLR